MNCGAYEAQGPKIPPSLQSHSLTFLVSMLRPRLFVSLAGNASALFLYGISVPARRLYSNGTEINQFDFQRYMAAKVMRVNEALDRAVPLRHPIRLHESMRYSLLSAGKRMCPIVALASSELVGGDEAAAMPVASATEMIHAMSLVHDDLPCMDDAGLRRGQPANHVAFGEATAVLAGDALLALAFEHVASSTPPSVPAERVVWALGELGAAVGSRGVAAGQMVDLASEGRDVDASTLEYIHLNKTAKLVEAAAVCGAIVGGGEVGEVERLRGYARAVGLLHQVIDDILDVTRTSAELGKTAGTDLASDKAAYPKILGLDGAWKFARTLVAQADEQLYGFDAGRAAPLYHLARYIINRQK